MNTRDLTCQRYGRLYVIERTEQKKGSCYLWRCLCDCGSEVLADTYMLTSGLKRSCGCLQTESRMLDLTGQRFGRLVVQRATGAKRNHNQVWSCLCDCGQLTEARTDNLRSGTTRSCGCLHVDTARQQQPDMTEKTFRDGTHPGRIASDKIQVNNTSGVKGVSWHRRLSKWQARIMFQGKAIILGTFAKFEDAVKERKEAEVYYFSEYLKAENGRLLV